jgi:1-deoxy-D-xylulose-5-phosphate synthase
VPGGRKASLAGWRGVKAVLSGAPALQAFVESLGVAYHGPVDGHDIEGLSEALEYAAARREPVLVHAITIKGLGYAPAEDDDDKKLHDVPPRRPTRKATEASGPQTFTEAFSEAAVALAESDERVIAISAAMVGSTGLAPMQERFPDRVLDVGIAEQHALTTAAGLGLGGARPIVAVYSTFMSRAFDQLNLDAAMHDCPLLLVMDRAGITGPDGPSHHGVLDLALALRVPGARVLTPSSPQLLYNLLTKLDGDHGPVIVRFPKKADFVPTEADGIDSAPLAVRLRDGSDGCIVAFGDRTAAAMDARKILRGHGLDVAVWASHQAKPVPAALLEGLAPHRLVLTVENGVRAGGAGEWLRDEAAQRSLDVAVHTHGLPTEFIPPGEASALLHRYALDGEGIAQRFMAIQRDVLSPVQDSGVAGSTPSDG